MTKQDLESAYQKILDMKQRNIIQHPTTKYYVLVNKNYDAITTSLEKIDLYLYKVKYYYDYHQIKS